MITGTVWVIQCFGDIWKGHYFTGANKASSPTIFNAQMYTRKEDAAKRLNKMRQQWQGYGTETFELQELNVSINATVIDPAPAV